GPLVGGWMARGGNYTLLWAATVGVCLLWLVAAFFVDRWDRRILAYEA
ncbi:MAG: hypothetical protein GX438_11515, partial [Treponema sp.]|nr:hypothetical protein [Treponema sp.]